ncbi:maleylpyruvate isomerase N-terminal domain-containing protein [Nocardia sp. NPDC052001]|uniref:maleylpyruvate isomerase N-terminal domain-containing protein n=1 Tax=Nocardia sp. NPDC052001 TaxID=3154853 RepID=UPI00343B478A
MVTSRLSRADALAALRTERSAVLEFYRALDAGEWAAPSAAAGWNVRDVLVHMTGAVRAAITPAALRAMTTGQIERVNDRVVAENASGTPEQAFADFEIWSARGITGLTAATIPGVAGLPLRVGELGWFPLRLFPALYVFDWHTHLRHDIAPALEHPAPETDARRMSAILDWLLALLEQSHRAPLRWLDAPVALTLSGPGGGTWRIEPAPRNRLRVAPGDETGTAARIRAVALEFPLWSTTRRPWTDCEVSVDGDAALGARFLDSINLV